MNDKSPARLARIKRKTPIYSWRLNSPISLEEVIKIEAEYQITLPEQYRVFITTIGNGGAGFFSLEESLKYDVPKNKDNVIDKNFFKIPFIYTSTYNPDEDAEIARLEKKWNRQEITQSEFNSIDNYLTAGTIVIKNDGCGHLIRLVITGVTKGTIWMDSTCNGQGYFPLNIRFLEWFEWYK